VLEGDHIPQLYLAPYYLVDTGHVMGTLSASPLSLGIDFVVSENKSATKVTAVVAGSSGRCRFVWAYHAANEVPAPLTEIEDPEARRHEVEDGPPLSSSAIDLPTGNWIVMVNVLDLETGAFKHYQEYVSTAPVAIEAPSPPLLVA
jgi:hypothetical protein